MTKRFRAPGRVNLIGEHTDYNDGFVMPAAIELETVATVGGSGWHSTDEPTGWTKYVEGVLKQLRQRGVAVPDVGLTFESTIPLGAGLSSSAALEVSAALAMLWAANGSMEKIEIAKACQQAEIETVGLGCGVMDQFASLHGVEGHAVMLDCRSLEHRLVPIPKNLALVIADTGVKHQLASSEYNARRADCEAAARKMGVSSLRDAATHGGDRRARHIVSENRRVLQFAEALAQEDRKAMGQLMAESHESLRVDYEVSCDELDAMVGAAQECVGLVGARMTGGGFGGSTINLVEAELASEFARQLAAGYRERTGIEARTYVTQAAAGAGPV